MEPSNTFMQMNNHSVKSITEKQGNDVSTLSKITIMEEELDYIKKTKKPLKWSSKETSLFFLCIEFFGFDL